jgi:hypothetical protein
MHRAVDVFLGATRTLAMLARRAGFSTDSTAPDALSTQAPSINIRTWRGSAMAAGRVCSVIDMGKAPRRRVLCYVGPGIATR